MSEYRDTSGENNPNAKITAEQAAELIELADLRCQCQLDLRGNSSPERRRELRRQIRELNYEGIAEKHGVSPRIASDVMHGATWRHLPRLFPDGIPTFVEFTHEQKSQIYRHAEERERLTALIAQHRLATASMREEIRLQRIAIDDATAKLQTIPNREDLAIAFGCATEIIRGVVEEQRRLHGPAKTFEELQAEAIALEQLDSLPEGELLRASTGRRRVFGAREMRLLGIYDAMRFACIQKAREHEEAAIRERSKASQYTMARLAKRFKVSKKTIDNMLRALPVRRPRNTSAGAGA